MKYSQVDCDDVIPGTTDSVNSLAKLASNSVLDRSPGEVDQSQQIDRRVIAGSSGWGKANDELHPRRGALGKQKQFVDVQIANLTRAIEGGSQNFRSVLARLSELESERDKSVEDIARTQREIMQSTILRPTAHQVQAAWSQLVDLWSGRSEQDA